MEKGTPTSRTPGTSYLLARLSIKNQDRCEPAAAPGLVRCNKQLPSQPFPITLLAPLTCR
eukprot:1157004-Pelagomonas_calceolata.AAC.2